MSIIDTLIIDRTQADAELARRLGAMGWAAMTDEQRALYLSDQLKGAYKASDLNRVNAAMDYLVGRLKAQGINVPIKRSKIPHKASGGKRLPEGHNELKWIESTGTQYIDTGIIGKTGVKAAGKFHPLSLESSIVLGCYNPQRCYMLSFNGSNIRYGYVDWYTATTDVSANVDYEFEVDFSAGSQHLKLNGTTYISSSNATTFTNSYTMYAFAYNDAGTAGDYAKCRMYSLQLYDNDTLVRDYVPDMLDSGEVGLYDLVEGKFYPNAGTGVFLAGDVADTKPNEDYDDYTWYDHDVPTPALLVEHLANAASVRSALVAQLPEIPSDMNDGLTIEEANNIELVLVTIEQFITNMLATYRHCGVTVSGMGGLFF